MDWETYADQYQRTWVNIGEYAYPLCGADGGHAARKDGSIPGVVLTPREIAAVRRGDYGERALAWLTCHEAHNMTPHWATSGVNTTGDWISVRPSWNPNPRDHMLDPVWDRGEGY